MIQIKRYQLRFILIIVLTIAMLLMAFGFIVYNMATVVLKEQLLSTAGSVAVSAGELIEVEIDEYEAYARQPDADSSFFIGMRNAFTVIQRASGVMQIRSLRLLEDGSTQCLLSSEDASLVPETYAVEGPAPDAFLVSAFASDNLTHAEREVGGVYGAILTVTAPIVHPTTGARVGIVAVDISIQYQNQSLRFLMLAVVSVLICVLLLICFCYVMPITTGTIRSVSLDGLTQAGNKRFFDTRLRRIVSMTRSSGDPLYVLRIDIDRFHSIIEQSGRSMADRVLIEFAALTQKQLRAGDLFARYGDESFIAALPGATQRAALRAAARIHDALAETTFGEDENGEGVSLTVSIGVAPYWKGQRWQQLIACAEKALAEAKAKGDNLCVIGEEVC